MSTVPPLIVRYLPDLQDYQTTLAAMRHYTDTRTAESADEIWFLQHPPVYTQGQNGKVEHILNAGAIPVIQVDRGGQVTYHGPGQIVAYLLIDLKRRQIGVRDFVRAIERAIIQVLADYKIKASNRTDAPGVYVEGAKIASLGLRVRRSCSYHGLAFNIDMDMTPFNNINPCGLAGITMVQLKDLAGPVVLLDVAKQLETYLRLNLNSTAVPAQTVDKNQ